MLLFFVAIFVVCGVAVGFTYANADCVVGVCVGVGVVIYVVTACVVPVVVSGVVVVF